MHDWQPIETAPKDGESILLYKPDGRREGPYIVAGYWWDTCGSAGWMPCAGSYILTPPTHWMPLPEPPK